MTSSEQADFARLYSSLVTARRKDVIRFARWLGCWQPVLHWCSPAEAADIVSRGARKHPYAWLLDARPRR